MWIDTLVSFEQYVLEMTNPTNTIMTTFHQLQCYCLSFSFVSHEWVVSGPLLLSAKSALWSSLSHGFQDPFSPPHLPYLESCFFPSTLFLDWLNSNTVFILCWKRESTRERDIECEGQWTEMGEKSMRHCERMYRNHICGNDNNKYGTY